MSTLLLFPGAGAGRDQSDAGRGRRRACARRGRRCAPTSRTARQGRKAPDRPPMLLAAVRDELAAIGEPTRRRRRRPVDGRADVLDGRRRRRRRAAAAAVAGVVPICYPLHPPGKPDAACASSTCRRRRAVPVRATAPRTRSARPTSCEQWTATIAGPVTHHWIDGGATTSRARTPRSPRPWPAWLATLVRARRSPAVVGGNLDRIGGPAPWA